MLSKGVRPRASGCPTAPELKGSLLFPHVSGQKLHPVDADFWAFNPECNIHDLVMELIFIDIDIVYLFSPKVQCFGCT